MELNIGVILLCLISNVLTLINIDNIESMINYYSEYPPLPEFFASTEQLLPSYDFIIIGGGSGGSVVANRLTEVSNWSVLVIEAGKEEIFLTDIPLLAALMQTTVYNWGYKTKPSEKNKKTNGGYCLSMRNQQCNWPRGKAVGGTSVINFMIHSRGSKRDFDSWKSDGNDGWGYDDVYKYFLKSEKLHLSNNYDNNSNHIYQLGMNESIYGKNGYLDVTMLSWYSELRDQFLIGGEELGYDIKDCNQVNPLGFCPVKVNLRVGRRVSASKAYIKPIKQRNNFHLSKYSLVTKIIIDPSTKTATGVEFFKNGQLYTVKAKKEVILSAGALNSPQILMLSGIGPKEHLSSHKINVIEDLPVGFNLQDHVSMAALTFLVNDTVTIVESRIINNLKNTIDYFTKGVGPLTLPVGAEALAFINTTDQHPDIELVFGVGAMTGDTSGSLRQIFGLPEQWFNEVFKDYLGHDAFSIVPILLYPKSRGRVTLKSSSPFDWPVLEPNYFDNEEDLETLVRGIKKAIEVASTKGFRQFNATLLPVKFPGCKELQFNTDNYWKCVCRQISTTLGHFVGTCKMGPRKSAGVVDNKLKVYGIKRLRIVDASIMPKLIAGHTNSPTYMIGEKASDLIKEEWLSL